MRRLRIAPWMLAATFAAHLPAQEAPALVAGNAGCPYAPSGLAGGDCSRPEELEHLRTGTGYTLAPRELEIDLIVTHLRLPGSDRSELRAEVTYGVSRRLQVEVGFLARYASEESRAEARDEVELEGKWVVAGGPRTVLAASAALELAPAGSGTGTEPAWGTEFSLALSRPWPALQSRVHVELGIETEGVEEAETLLFNAAGEHAIGRGLLAELAWNGRVEAGRVSGALVPALEWRPGGGRADGLTVALGVPIGVTTDAERWGVIVHLEIEF